MELEQGKRLFFSVWLGVLLTAATLPNLARAQTIEWIRQFGSASDDLVWGVALDATGVYVVGATNGTLPGQTSAGGTDAFVRKYNINGNEQGTRQFDTARGGVAQGVVGVDATGVYVVGGTGGALPGQTSAGGSDAFVVKLALTSACTYSIAPTSQSFPASGGISRVSVITEAGRAGAAGSKASWISF